MKKLLILTLLTLSALSFADDCTIKTKARPRVYPLAMSFQSKVVQAIDLQDCIDQAKLLLGTQYEGILALPGGLTSSGGTANVTYTIKKVKYRYTQDGILYKGSIK